MVKKFVAIKLALLFTAAVIASGCQTVGENPGAATGGAVGAGAGAIIGSQMSAPGARTEGAVIGAIIGGLTGAILGHYNYDVQRTRQDTAQRYAYNPSQGTVVYIEDVQVYPVRVRPGDRVDMRVTYALLTPDPNMPVRVNEIREIKSNGQIIGKPEVTVTRYGGTFTTTVPLFVPRNAVEGVYKVMTIIDAGSAKDSRESSFEVSYY